MSLGKFRMCNTTIFPRKCTAEISGKLCQNKTFAMAFSAQHSKSNSSRRVKIHSECQRFTSKFAARESSPLEYLHIWSLSIFVVVALTLQLKHQSRDKLKDTELNSICNNYPTVPKCTISHSEFYVCLHHICKCNKIYHAFVSLSLSHLNIPVHKIMGTNSSQLYQQAS